MCLVNAERNGLQGFSLLSIPTPYRSVRVSGEKHDALCVQWEGNESSGSEEFGKIGGFPFFS